MIAFDISFDPIAFCTALFAVWFVYRESRRNNQVILKLGDCSASHIRSVDEKPHYELQMLIENRGRPLHDLSLSLTFSGKGGCGSFGCSIPMRSGEPRFSGEFSRGMVAEFVLRTDRLDQPQLSILSVLEDATKQNAAIAVYSQEYLVKVFCIGGVRDRLKSRWRNFAGTINFALRRQVGTAPEGHAIIKTRRLLPVPVVLLPHVRYFLASCKKLLSKRTG